MPDLPFLGCILYNVFGEVSNSFIVSGPLANLIMISEEHRENDEISFQNVCDFFFHRYPCMTKENVML